MLNNNISLRSIAQQQTLLSSLQTGRTQMHTEDLAGQTLTISQVDIAVLKGKRFPVFVFSEYPDSYYNGGMVLAKIVDAWVEICDGDIDAVNEMLTSEPVQIRFRKTTTKDGERNIVVVDVI